MKMNFFLWVVFIAGITFLTACKKSETSQKHKVMLYHCTQKTMDPYICFDSLITDSRCPKKVECVWQGTAIIKVSFYESGNIHRFKMSLKGFPNLGSTSDTIINGHRIVFTDLAPYPELNNPLPEVRETMATFIILP